MASKPKNGVPRGTDDPIAYLLKNGWTESTLAVEWGLKAGSSIYKLRAFHHVPKFVTAVRMAKTLGWSSAGEVMDHWAARVES